ncbi:hypothetical protein PybrP1_011882 [[Pythium] brassicae (nom. inval.)]|nr:hypothetical protein PybrP1_011882 [[Pythium] brassicae (nom. inval.)]
MAARRPQSPFALDAADAAACGLVPSAFELTLVNDAAAALPDDAPVFDALGQISTPAAVRARLLRTYVAREAEATLRVDIELELLRQRCFAERNAQWGFVQPADFDWRPSPEAARWAPALVANTSVALRRLRHDAAAEREDKDAAAGSAALAAAAAASGGFVSAVGSGGVKKDERGFPLGQFSRERPWPPREFTQRAAVKPVRQRGGKRKAPAAVVEERSIFSKVCVACRTQSTPLWRKLPRDGVGGAKAAAKVPAAAQLPASGTAAGSAANGEVGDTAGASGATLPAVPMADVCLACFLKIQRSDLFARKKAEHERKLREQKERAAAERALEKKRLKQQTQLLKKHQQTPHQQPQQPPAHVKSKKRRTAEPQPVPPSPVPSHQPEEPVTVATPEAAPAPIKIPPPHRSAKRDRKKSKKDKKKKKKKRKRAADSDSDDDDDDAPLPSPPQISGQYEYADVRKRAAQSSAKPSFDEADEEEPVPSALLAAAATREKLVEADEAPKRSRKPVVRIDSGLVSAPPVQPASASSSSSSLRKRRNSVVAVATATAAGLPDEPVKPSSRPVRSKTPVAAAATAPSTAENALPPTPAAAAAVSPAAGALGARKRARAKKESARERELRALGQYCPVCNAVYEEDDESTFVCCDSCEMWVHGSCDPTLTAAAIAALSDSNEKYICPLCAG